MNTQTISLNSNWKFYLGDLAQTETADVWYKNYDDKSWENVFLPHDWSVALPFSVENSSGTGYLSGGIGWYRLHFSLPEGFRGKRIRIVFDGVYKNARVWCNSYHLGLHPYGYTAFSYDISDFICFGEEENVICVSVTHTDIADSRWFTGSGMTRKVSLVVEENIHPIPNGIFFSTLHACEENACVEISHTLTNTGTASSFLLEASLLEPTNPASSAGLAAGHEVLRLSANCTLTQGETNTILLNGKVLQPQLWSPDFPQLYRLEVSVTPDGRERSLIYSGSVGIRTFAFDADTGFSINGVSCKLKGVCVHHDGGCLGAAMTKEIWERRLLKLKKCGCNAIRTSHNPHMPELYELCDKLGFFVMDEAFDEWENPKNKWSVGHNVYPPKHQGYAWDFPQWHKKDLLSMVYRDRNHPSIILWSIGNEIDYPNDPYCHPLFETMTGNNDANKPSAEKLYDSGKPNTERLSAIAAELSSIVREADTTRPVTLATAFPELTSQTGLFDSLDVIGYNYKEHLYAQDHERFPHLPLLGSENSHSYQAWKAVSEHEYISGQFLWTGIDYLGEAKGWPVHGSPAGILTLAGFEKTEYYRRSAFWCNTPVLYLTACSATAAKEAADTEDYENCEWLPMEEHYNFTEGEEILVRCYTNLSAVTLSQNGIPIEQSPKKQFGCLQWKLPFCSGTLKASASSIEYCLSTTSAPAHLIWQQYQPQSGSPEIEQLTFALTDESLLPVAWKDILVEVTVSSGGTLLGLENGNLSDYTPCQSNKRSTFHGKLICYIRRIGNEPINVMIQGEGIPSLKIQLETFR